MKAFATGLMILALVVAGGCRSSRSVEGEGGRKLTIEKPKDMDIEQNQTKTVEVDIKRKNFTGPVTVTLDNLPKGVDVVDGRLGGLKVDGDKAAFTLKAEGDAPMTKDHMAQVKVVGPDGMAVTENFEITIKEGKGAPTTRTAG